MKILFLVFHGFAEGNGISKKIFYQVDGLKDAGHDVSLASYTILENGHRARMINEDILEDYGPGGMAGLKSRTSYDSLYNYITDNNIEVLYVRSFHNANPFLIRFFRKLSKAGIKSVMEIPTYPYDQEYEGMAFSFQVELSIDKLFRKKLVSYFNYIVTFSDYKEIFGKETIRISNGIDFAHIKMKEHQNDTTKTIHMIGVAEIHYWHGYDRAIKGLGEYYAQPHDREIYFHIVGGMADTEKYGSSRSEGFMPLIEKYGIEKYIIFHGQQSGDNLDRLFEQSDIAIGSLARHRSGIDKIKTLKNREYAARGIPFVYSETDDDFESMPYIQKVPADETPLDITKMINFYDNLTITPLEIRNSIKHLAWKEQMQRVIDALNSK